MRRSVFHVGRLWGLASAGAVAIALAGPADARVLGFHGTLALQLGPLGTLVTRGDGSAVVNGSGGQLGEHLDSLELAATGLIAGTATVPVSSPSLTGLVSFRGTAILGSGTLLPISGGAASAGGLTRNTLPVGGEVRLCFFFMGCQSFLPIPLTVGGTRGVGIGGLVTVGTFAPAGARISVLNAPWTIKTALISLSTANGGIITEAVTGFAHGPESATSSTLAVGGVVQLVTPTRVISTLAPDLALFGILTLHFVPEPSTFLLLGMGVVGLGVARRGLTRT